MSLAGAQDQQAQGKASVAPGSELGRAGKAAGQLAQDSEAASARPLQRNTAAWALTSPLDSLPVTYSLYRESFPPSFCLTNAFLPVL